MKTFIKIFLILIFCIKGFSFNTNLTQEIDAKTKVKLFQKTLYFFDWLDSKESQKAVDFFHNGSNKKVLKKQLEGNWQFFIENYGKLKEVNQLSIKKERRDHLVYGKLLFESEKEQGIKIKWNYKNQIDLFELIPASQVPEGSFSKRPYIKMNKFEIQEVQVGQSLEKLPGKLFIPKGVKNPPILIFSHDFGPQDLYHRVGVNSFFKDIAQGLASNGIAAFLYPKRSKVYPKMIQDKTVTPQKEVIQDLYYTIYSIKNNLRLKNSKIYFLGYGFSSWFAPWFAKKDRFDGYVLLNPSFRNPADILFEITEFYQAREKTPNIDLMALNQKLELLANRKLGYNETIFGYPSAYFYHLESYKPEVLAPDTKGDFYVFASKDFVQNPSDPFTIDQILKNKEYKTYSFPMLNRIFHVSKEENPDLDFLTPGLVSAKVILIIKNWILDKK